MHYSEFDGETEEGWAYKILDKFTRVPSRFGTRVARLRNGREVQFDGHEVLQRVEFRDQNTLLGDPTRDNCTIIAGGECRIWFNDYQIYSFRYTELNKAIVKLLQVVDKLLHFPVPLTSRKACESLVGRLIYYREFPAKILDIDGELGLIVIAVVNDVRTFTPEPWAHEADTAGSGLKVDLLSGQIHWFRDEPD
jgi:hypothetical protein